MAVSSPSLQQARIRDTAENRCCTVAFYECVLFLAVSASLHCKACSVPFISQRTDGVRCCTISDALHYTFTFSFLCMYKFVGAILVLQCISSHISSSLHLALSFFPNGESDNSVISLSPPRLPSSLWRWKRQPRSQTGGQRCTIVCSLVKSECAALLINTRQVQGYLHPFVRRGG